MRAKINIKTVAIAVAIIIAIVAFATALKIIIQNAEINKQMESAIHAVTIDDEVQLYKNTKLRKKIASLQTGTDTYILETVYDENGNKLYKVKTGKKVGYVLAQKIGYYKKANMKKERMIDVSQFNLGNSFQTVGEFKSFLINNNIKYVYIRAGGRGYGQAGKMYKDSKFKEYADACEYLKIPFGVYFLDEAITSDEVDEEVQFIYNFLEENKYNYNTLPVALDVEKHLEEGRADGIWNTRSTLVNELIEKLNNKNKKVIIYSNAKIANQYLTDVNTQLWLAYYPSSNKEPKYWYSDTDEEASQNIDLISKMVAWQFTETGISNKIPQKVDISIVYKSFFSDNSMNDIQNDISGTSKPVQLIFELKDKWKKINIFSLGRTMNI